MNHQIDIQIACAQPLPVSEPALKSWVNSALANHPTAVELTLRCVDIAEISYLNKTYRQQDKPTNVLAFPSTIPDTIILDFPLLGDIIICPDILAKEADEQHISLEAHWAHIVIHGTLHLLGFDHIDDDDAARMQAVEISLLSQSGFANPYSIERGETIE